MPDDAPAVSGTPSLEDVEGLNDYHSLVSVVDADEHAGEPPPCAGQLQGRGAKRTPHSEAPRGIRDALAAEGSQPLGARALPSELRHGRSQRDGARRGGGGGQEDADGRQLAQLSVCLYGAAMRVGGAKRNKK